LFLGEIIKIVATRCQILRLKCTKFDFGWRSVPDPAGRAYSAPPDLLAGFKGPTSKRREGRGKKGEQGGEGRGQEKGEGRWKGEGKGAEGWEGKFMGQGEERGGEGKFRGLAPQCFFPRTAPGYKSFQPSRRTSMSSRKFCN